MRGQKGFSLVEVIIGVTILAVVIVGLLAALTTGILGIGRVDQRTMALNLAQSQLEHIKSQDYQTYDLTPTPYPTIPSIPSGYTVAFIVSEVTGVGTHVLQQITVTVTYDNGSATLAGYKSNIPIGPPPSPLCPETVEIAGTLDAETGYYFTFTAGAGSTISASWTITKNQDIEIWIYSDEPFGPGEDTSSHTPSEVDAYYPTYGLTHGYDAGPTLTVTTSERQPAGTYTVYFYNAHATKSATTDLSSVTYARP